MAGGDREKALDAALANIEKQFGKGSVMRLGDESRAPVEVIPTGSIALDIALGIGGLPRGWMDHAVEAFSAAVRRWAPETRAVVLRPGESWEG